VFFDTGTSFYYFFLGGGNEKIVAFNMWTWTISSHKRPFCFGLFGFSAFLLRPICFGERKHPHPIPPGKKENTKKIVERGSQVGKYSARSEVSFPPLKTLIRPKITKIVSEGLFDVFTVQNRVPRPESVQIKVLKHFFSTLSWQSTAGRLAKLAKWKIFGKVWSFFSTFQNPNSTENK